MSLRCNGVNEYGLGIKGYICCMLLYMFFLREVTSQADILQLNESRHIPWRRGGNPSG